MALRISSPAKLNLFLAVRGKRPDGYHEIETLFERIDLVDKIFLEKASSGITFGWDADSSLPARENLAVRAAVLFKKHFGIRRGVRIQIQKRIPLGAGLGGGSSNAASVLMGLARLWKIAPASGELQVLGASLGSDVPFFLLNRSFAIGRGRGEELVPVETEARLWHVLVFPDASLSTAAVYGALRQRALTPSPRADSKLRAEAFRKREILELARRGRNDLRRGALKLLPDLKDLEAQVRHAGVHSVSLSGSGPTLFTTHGNFREASRMRLVLSRRISETVMLAKTLSSH